MKQAVACSIVVAALATGGMGRDPAAQSCALEVSEWSPRGSATTAKPRITATIQSSCGVPIDSQSVQMTVDDEAVVPKTDGAGPRLTVVYVPESALVEDADHTVTLRARDAKGTAVEKVWTFHLGDTYSR